MEHIPAFPEASPRVQALLARMTLREKLAQLVGYWLDQNGTVAPMQGEMSAGQKDAGTLAEVTADGIGHYTRVYGTRPVEPARRAAWLWREQRRLKRETRLGIPALVHEECLTGLAAWHAAVIPTPLAWGAAFDPTLVRETAREVGAAMRALGVHQGLAPVLDVIRDPRWGRVDECIGEDPYLVGTVGTAYVQGLQEAGVDATLKHFLGYSASQAGRNHAPVHAGPREMAEVFLPPFEMAVRDGGAASVMNAYTARDGVPAAADPELLTDVLRGQLGFDGVVVADYFSVAFLEVMQTVAADRAEAAVLALRAGVDVELPTGDAYLEPLAAAVAGGAVEEVWVDRAVVRVLRQKERLGLLDPDAYEDDPPAEIDLDTPRQRALARRLAAESLVLLRNDRVAEARGAGGADAAGPGLSGSGTAGPDTARQDAGRPGAASLGEPPVPDHAVLPLRPDLRPDLRLAVIGPDADRPEALQGCYSFANHVLAHHPGTASGVRIPTVAEALAAAVAGPVAVVPGGDVTGDDRSGFADAAAAALAADAAVVIVGDQAGLFGRGTVGEGNDAESLELPGVQRELVEAVLDTGTPTVVVLLTGRPYALGWLLDAVHPASVAVVQAFFPGEEGGTAVADVLLGRTCPSGRLPVSLPRSAGAQPFGYLHPVLGGDSEVTATRTAPVRPFGFGLSYTGFAYRDLTVDDRCATDGVFDAAVTVDGTGGRGADHVVQLYGRDLVGSTARPVVQLLGYARVQVEAGASVRVRFRVPTARFGAGTRDLGRVVEPGLVQVWVGSDAEATVDPQSRGHATRRATLELTGPVHTVTADDPRLVQWEAEAAPAVLTR